jgi:hypothetical protein
MVLAARSLIQGSEACCVRRRDAGQYRQRRGHARRRRDLGLRFDVHEALLGQAVQDVRDSAHAASPGAGAGA